MAGRKNKKEDLGEALLRGAAPMLAVEYDDDGIPLDLKPSDILAFLHKLEAYNMSQPADKDKMLMLPSMAAEWIGFIETFEDMRLVPKDPDDTESEKVPLLSYGTLNPERAQDRKKMLEHDQRMAKELRKEFGRASDHSTFYDALMKLWKTFVPSGSGPANDFASMNIKMGVVAKNATGRLLKDLSPEESQQLYDWMSKGLIANFPSLAQEMSKTPKDQKPTNFSEWMQEMVAAGKQFDKNMKLFGDYAPMHPTVKELLSDKDRQIADLGRKIQQLQSTRGGEKPAGGRGGEKSGGRGGEKPPSGSDRGGERQTGNWNGQQHNHNQPNQNRSATGFKPHNPDIICQSCGQKGHPSHKCPNKKAESSAAAAQWVDKQDQWEESPEMQARLFEAFQAGRQARK
jgi:hypothetical protein